VRLFALELDGHARGGARLAEPAALGGAGARGQPQAELSKWSCTPCRKCVRRCQSEKVRCLEVGESTEYRRRPEQSVLHQMVREGWPKVAESMRLPPRVHEEVGRYLGCGQLRRGFTVVRCDDCGTSDLVAFSCKSRAWCPSCGARRAHETALLLDEVLPRVGYRQWTLSIRFALRFLLVKEPKLLRKVERRLVEVLFRWQRHRARGLGASGKRVGGAVSFVQLFNAHLGLSPHVHLLGAEGVWNDGVFLELPAPSPEEVEGVLERCLAQLLPDFEARGAAWPEDEYQALQAKAAQLRLPLDEDAPPARRGRDGEHEERDAAAERTAKERPERGVTGGVGWQYAEKDDVQRVAQRDQADAHGATDDVVGDPVLVVGLPAQIDELLRELHVLHDALLAAQRDRRRRGGTGREHQPDAHARRVTRHGPGGTLGRPDADASCDGPGLARPAQFRRVSSLETFPSAHGLSAATANGTKMSIAQTLCIRRSSLAVAAAPTTKVHRASEATPPTGPEPALTSPGLRHHVAATMLLTVLLAGRPGDAQTCGTQVDCINCGPKGGTTLCSQISGVNYAYCCFDICGSGQYSGFARSSCCPDMCGGSGGGGGEVQPPDRATCWNGALATAAAQAPGLGSYGGAAACANLQIYAYERMGPDGNEGPEDYAVCLPQAASTVDVSNNGNLAVPFSCGPGLDAFSGRLLSTDPMLVGLCCPYRYSNAENCGRPTMDPMIGYSYGGTCGVYVDTGISTPVPTTALTLDICCPPPVGLVDGGTVPWTYNAALGGCLPWGAAPCSGHFCAPGLQCQQASDGTDFCCPPGNGFLAPITSAPPGSPGSDAGAGAAPPAAKWGCSTATGWPCGAWVALLALRPRRVRRA
jgi:hypothetical protein